MSIDLQKMPKLGFGLMRLPEKDGVIDSEHLNRMVDAYMQAGMNYFDTAYGRASECIGCGQCEGVCPQHLPIIDLLKDASAKLDA
jgi:predicted aldo/keto reductase-like oxidoreductase